MANKTCVSLDNDEYFALIEALSSGFQYKDSSGKTKRFFPNRRVALILQLEAVLGLRIGDILKLRLDSLVKDGNRYRFDITEEKTGKKRQFTVPSNVYNRMCEYAIDRNLSKSDLLFPMTERNVQKSLKLACNHLADRFPDSSFQAIGSHSFRKRFAHEVYEESGKDIEATRELLCHSSTQITQRYLALNNRALEDVLHTRSKDLII